MYTSTIRYSNTRKYVIIIIGVMKIKFIVPTFKNMRKSITVLVEMDMSPATV